MEREIETVNKLIATVTEFAVAYGFQILGALFFLVVGLKLAAWCGGRVASLADARTLDTTLSRFIGNVVRVLLIGFVVVITLGNFGISIAPLIALAGASAFGATIAMQGPLSNYGAGLSIVLGRPFVVGNTITLKSKRASGVVETIGLAATQLVGEDGERITIPNKEIVGQVIVNSDNKRIVETQIHVPIDTDVERAVEALRRAVGSRRDVATETAPQIGVHDFAYGAIVLGIRYWVPSRSYHQTRYAVNSDLLAALRGANIPMLPTAGVAVPLRSAAEPDGT